MKHKANTKDSSGQGLDLIALLPGYLERRQQDINRIGELYKELKFSEMARIAHKIKGTGSGYGLPELSRQAGHLEKAVKANDPEAMEESIGKIKEIVSSELQKLALNLEA